jgi:gamma-glutamyltranspeptidase/glutathione hydrolase
MRIPHGMVVSAHRLASEAGVRVLRRGGNAFDAAVATSLMLGVVEPAFSGIGGGGFALLHTSSGEDVALDYRETAPRRSTASMYSDGSDANRVGPLAVATPGLLAGEARTLEMYGTMKLRDLAEGAIETARAGFDARSVSRDLILERNPQVMVKVERFRATADAFVGHDDLPLLAKTLSDIAKSGHEKFYQGDIPASIAKYLKSIGGILDEEDFGRYAPKERKPVRGSYRGLEVVSMPPPSAGGALLVHGLGVLEESGGPPETSEAARVDFTAAIIESMLKEKAAFGDPDFVDVPASRLTSMKAISQVAEEIRERKSTVGTPTHDIGSTTHFCVVDREGNAVAATETVECFYGSGVTVPGLGILLNDEMHDFDPIPGRPNSVAPLKRPASNMSPTILMKDGAPYLVLGASGAERIISSLFQVVTNVVERKMDLAQALAAPRIHPLEEGLMVEGGLTDADVRALRNLGHVPKVGEKSKLFYGGVQAVMVDGGIVTGAADPRRRGEAVIEG